jgi:hypothetical protein
MRVERSRLVFAGRPQESTGHPRDMEPVSDDPFVDGDRAYAVARANASTFSKIDLVLTPTELWAMGSNSALLGVTSRKGSQRTLR